MDLWNTLSAKYVEDKGTFVSTIAGAVETWLKRLEALLEGDEAFQEAFLEKMEGVRKALYVQVSPPFSVNVAEYSNMMDRSMSNPIQRQLLSEENSLRSSSLIQEPQNIAP